MHPQGKCLLTQATHRWLCNTRLARISISLFPPSPLFPSLPLSRIAFTRFCGSNCVDAFFPLSSFSRCFSISQIWGLIPLLCLLGKRHWRAETPLHSRCPPRPTHGDLVTNPNIPPTASQIPHNNLSDNAPLNWTEPVSGLCSISVAPARSDEPERCRKWNDLRFEYILLPEGKVVSGPAQERIPLLAVSLPGRRIIPVSTPWRTACRCTRWPQSPAWAGLEATDNNPRFRPRRC